MHALDVLGDPVRRRILELLAEGELASGEVVAPIAAEFALSPSAVAQHLKLLRENGFAVVRSQGPRRYYSVDSRSLQEIDRWLDHIRAVWDGRIDTLSDELVPGPTVPAGPLPNPPPAVPASPESVSPSSPEIDLAEHVDAIGRQVSQRSTADGPHVIVTVSRYYPAEMADVWAALTEPDRVRHWFLVLTGDLRPGWTFQLEGNASGDIVTCQPPRHLVVTFGGPSSVIDLTLTAHGEGTMLSFDHTVPIEMAGSSAGALYVGPGWDGALMGLALYLAGQVDRDPIEASNSREGQEFCALSVDAWVAVVEASGTADATAIAAAKKVSLAQFAPDLGH